MMEPDIVGALCAIVKADPTVNSLVGDNVFGGELPPGFEMPQEALVISASGGAPLTSGGSAEVDTQRIDVTGYGATPADANRVRGAAAKRIAAILRETALGTLIHWANRAGGFSQARDRDGQWPQSFQSFQVFHSLQEV